MFFSVIYNEIDIRINMIYTTIKVGHRFQESQNYAELADLTRKTGPFVIS